MEREERNYRRPRRYRNVSEDDIEFRDDIDGAYDRDDDMYDRDRSEKAGYDRNLRNSRRNDGRVIEHSNHGNADRRYADDRFEHDRYDDRDERDYYDDRSEYFRERDRYFAERDRYYQERDRYYNDMDEYSRIASSAADEAYDDRQYSRRRDVSEHRRDAGESSAGYDGHSQAISDNKSVKMHDQEPRKNSAKPDDAVRRSEAAEKLVRKSAGAPQGNSSAKADANTNTNAKQNALKTSAANNQKGTAPGQKGKKKKGILWIILALLLIFVAFVGIKFVKRQSGYYTVAVFGVDSRDGNVGKGALSDVNMIARVDMATGEIKLVSIYRDTYTQIDKDGNYHKFNEAYFRGGPEQAIWALENNTDVKVDDYVTFNWKAVVDAINILGGVDIDITDAEFKYINAYITETVNSTGVGSVQLQHAGMNHLDGVQAVAYARLRKMDSDYTRTERQRKVISLALDKAKNADFSVLNNILVTVLPQTSTSVGISDILPFAKDINKYYIGETAGFPFDKKGQNVGKLDAVIPVTWESNDIALHEFLYPGESYTPSKLVKEISAHVAERTGLGGSGETSVKVDDLSTGQGGNAQAIEETVPESESETETIDESESESETIEEIIDDSTIDEEEDNDSYDDEDMVPGGSNSNVNHGGNSNISDEPESTYDVISNDSGIGPGAPGSDSPSGNTEDRSDARESVEATKIE